MAKSSLIERNEEKLPADLAEGTIRIPREDDVAKRKIKEALTKLTKLDGDLVDLRKPVNEKVAEIKGVYDMLEKEGFDRGVIKAIHKARTKGQHNAEYCITWNSYVKTSGVQLPLFDVSDTAQH